MSIKKVLLKAARTQKEKKQIEKMSEAEAVNLMKILKGNKTNGKL